MKPERISNEMTTQEYINIIAYKIYYETTEKKKTKQKGLAGNTSNEFNHQSIRNSV